MTTPQPSDTPPLPGERELPAAVGPATVILASYDAYAKAQRAVDFLSDEGFPVQHTAIIGSGLHTVESITGRLTTWRAALGAAISGLWFGLLIGLILAIANNGDTWIIGVALLVGIVGGALYGLIAHAATRGKRDFSSSRTVIASQYEVTVTPEYAVPARAKLSELPTTF